MFFSLQEVIHIYGFRVMNKTRSLALHDLDFKIVFTWVFHIVYNMTTHIMILEPKLVFRRWRHPCKFTCCVPFLPFLTNFLLFNWWFLTKLIMLFWLKLKSSQHIPWRTSFVAYLQNLDIVWLQQASTNEVNNLKSSQDTMQVHKLKVTMKRLFPSYLN